MAITWELTVTPISIPAKEASIRAVRDEDGTISEYDVAKATIDIEIMANNIPIMDEIWVKHQERLTRDSDVAAFCSELEAAGKANLEARE